MLAAIDGGLLLQVVWVSLASTIVVTVLFSLVVLFASRSLERQRAGSAGSAAVLAVCAFVALGAFAFTVGYGVHVMLQKG